MGTRGLLRRLVRLEWAVEPAPAEEVNLSPEEHERLVGALAKFLEELDEYRRGVRPLPEDPGERESVRQQIAALEALLARWNKNPRVA